MSTNNSVPGLEYPTQKAMLAGTPRASAMASMTGAAQSQANANRTLAGGRRKYRGGALAPQMQLLYTPQGGPGTNPNEQMAGNAKTSTQMAANRVNDNQATQMGGSKRKRKGGNPDWVWGCLSGGKKYSRKYSKKSRKHTRKSRKHARKSRKYRKN